MQDNNHCEHEYKNIPGVGKVCTRCGEGTEYQTKEKNKPARKEIYSG